MTSALVKSLSLISVFVFSSLFLATGCASREEQVSEDNDNRPYVAPAAKRVR